MATACHVTLLVLGLAALVCGNAHMDKVEVDFDAKPNAGARHAEARMAREGGKGDVVCSFDFSCVGGTNENWIMTIERSGDAYMCTIARPEQTSYLFFLDFTLSFEEGAKVVHGEAYDNDAQISSDQYTVDGNKMSSSDNFKNSLAMAQISQH